MNGLHGTCKGACCKTPFGVCAKSNNCACHWVESNKAAVQDVIEEQNQQQRKIAYEEALRLATYGERMALYQARAKQGKGKK